MQYLITGTAQGIGLELTKMALNKKHHVLGIARNRENSSELESLKKQFDSLEILYVDLSTLDAPDKVVAAAAKYPQIDVLINNAGIYRKGETRGEFEESFLVNTITPFLLSKALLPQLKKSTTPKCIHISSLMGSISENTSGGSHAYRSSKTALNMLMKGLSIDENWLATMCVHPGWVQTRMGTDAAPLSIQESAAGIFKVIGELSLSESGSFKDYLGTELSW